MRVITVLKVFVFSNSICTYTFLYIIEWLLGKSIDTVITTDETLFEQLVNNFSFKIKYYASIESCVSNCDIALVYNDDNLPKEVIKKVKHITTIQDKKYIEIDGGSLSSKSKMEIDVNNINNLKIPSVAICSVGLATIPMKVEFDINRVFWDAGVQINHFLSLESTHIVTQFIDSGINEDRLKLFNRFQDSDVSVYFIDLGNSVYNVHEYYNLLSVIKPDYVIILTDYDMLDYDELNMHIKSFCMRFPDIIIKSRWFSFGNNMFCHSDDFNNQLYENNQIILDFEDKFFLEKLKYDMFSKISLPAGVKRIK